MAEKQGVIELFKAEQPMLWVRKMNGIRTAAEEMVLTEIVYGQEVRQVYNITRGERFISSIIKKIKFIWGYFEKLYI